MVRRLSQMVYGALLRATARGTERVYGEAVPPLQ